MVKVPDAVKKDVNSTSIYPWDNGFCMQPVLTNKISDKSKFEITGVN